MNQSSSTWRHSNIQYTFPRARRFRQATTSNQSMYDLKTENSARACSLGRGEKYYIPIWERKKMKELPGPGRYLEVSLGSGRSSERRSFSKGSRFGVGGLGVPGPGAYETSRSCYAKDISLKGKYIDFAPKQQPGPF
jgi:hypothetical protein